MKFEEPWEAEARDHYRRAKARARKRAIKRMKVYSWWKGVPKADLYSVQYMEWRRVFDQELGHEGMLG